MPEKLYADFVLVPAHKAANNVIMVCKKYYIKTLVKEPGIKYHQQHQLNIYSMR